MNYSLEDVRKIILLENNQRFLWTQYHYHTPKLTSQALRTIRGMAAQLREYSEVFKSEINSLENLAEVLSSRVEDSCLDDVPF